LTNALEYIYFAIIKMRRSLNSVTGLKCRITPIIFHLSNNKML